MTKFTPNTQTLLSTSTAIEFKIDRLLKEKGLPWMATRDGVIGGAFYVVPTSFTDFPELVTDKYPVYKIFVPAENYQQVSRQMDVREVTKVMPVGTP